MPELVGQAGLWQIKRVQSLLGVRYWFCKQGAVELCLTEDEYRELRQAMGCAT